MGGEGRREAAGERETRERASRERGTRVTGWGKPRAR